MSQAVNANDQGPLFFPIFNIMILQKMNEWKIEIKFEVIRDSNA